LTPLCIWPLLSAPQLKELKEGDLVLDYKDEELMNASMNNEQRRKRGMIPSARKLWISRVVPYAFNHPGTLFFSTGKRLI